MEAGVKNPRRCDFLPRDELPAFGAHAGVEGDGDLLEGWSGAGVCLALCAFGVEVLRGCAWALPVALRLGAGGEQDGEVSGVAHGGPPWRGAYA